MKNTLEIRLRVMSCEVKRPVAAKFSWVDPTSFVAMNLNTLLLYFTKLSGKSQDFCILVGTHLNGLVRDSVNIYVRGCMWIKKLRTKIRLIS